jgi:hypothetical protein
MMQKLGAYALIGSTVFTIGLSSTSAQTLAQQRSTSSLSLTAQQKLCMINAVNVREARILGALNTFNTRMERTLQARRALIKSAWSQNDGRSRRSNLQSIWKKFGFTWKDETEAMKAEMREAWMAYRSSRSECKIVGYDDETGGLSMDSQF